MDHSMGIRVEKKEELRTKHELTIDFPTFHKLQPLKIYEKFMDNSMGISVEKKKRKRGIDFSRRGAEDAELL